MRNILQFHNFYCITGLSSITIKDFFFFKDLEALSNYNFKILSFPIFSMKDLESPKPGSYSITEEVGAEWVLSAKNYLES